MDFLGYFDLAGAKNRQSRLQALAVRLISLDFALLLPEHATWLRIIRFYSNKFRPDMVGGLGIFSIAKIVGATSASIPFLSCSA